MRQLSALFIVIIYIVSLLLDWYIYADIRRYSSQRFKSLYSRAYVVFVMLCMALLTWIVIYPKDRDNVSLTPLMWMIYSYASIYFPKLLYVIISSFGRFITWIGKFHHNRGVVFGVIAGVMVCGAMWWGIGVTRYKIDVKQIEISSSKLPPSFDGYKLVQFSDAHVGTWGADTTFVTKLVDRINSLNPDMIVFTGDIVNRETSELKPFLSVLKRLKARDGVYSILGNHDYGDYTQWNSPNERVDNNKLLLKWEKQMGWHMLNNDHIFIKNGNDSIALIGVENWGEPPFHQYGKLQESYTLRNDSSLVDDALNDDNFKILLSHNPEHWNREVTLKSNINLTLSGHTHAMQMMIGSGDKKWSPAAWRYKRWGGLYTIKKPNNDDQHLYVNIGCGEVGIPARFGSAYPEVTEIILKSDDTK